MNILSIEDISKTYGIKPLFEHTTFGLDQGDKIGIIGANGSGKSTLLKIIAGIEPADSGRVVFSNNLNVSYLSQNPLFDPDKTILDTVFDASNKTIKLIHDYEEACQQLSDSSEEEPLIYNRVSELAEQLEAVGAWEIEKKAKIVLNKLGILDIKLKMGRLSGGQRKKVALAHTLIINPDLLILDEPTNHLDADTVAWLESYLNQYTGTLVLVTHDRYFLDRVTNRILEVDRSTVQSFAGNYTTYLEKKEEQENQRAAEAHKRESLLRRELAWLRRGAKARTSKEKARIDRVKRLMDQPKETPKSELEISAGKRRMGNKILEIDQISKSYSGKVLIKNFSYTIKRGDRIGIIGPNGSGKTTLLDIIVGQTEPNSGRVETGQTIVIGYYDQENRPLNSDQRVIDYIKEVGERVPTADGSFISASQMLERFLFPPAMQYSSIGKLSGGEKRRLYLLRVLMSSPNLLILDEPTNDLDIPTLVALEDYLDSFSGCLIVVSHDRYFLDRTVEHIFRFENDGEIREYPGNYSEALELIERQIQKASNEDKATKTHNHTRPNTKAQTEHSVPRKLSFKEKRELEELEIQIQLDENRKVEIQAELVANPTDAQRVYELYKELQIIDERLNVNLDRWAELADLSASM
jgi:ABC transport system ATP-binding/permease protein